MTLFFLAFIGGVLTILSPCILPVLPFVFSRADRSFWKNGLPLLGGMAVTFTLVASLASYGGGWVVEANAIGRAFALVLLALFAISLLSERVAEWISRPFVRLGNVLSRASFQGNDVLQSFTLGVATGLLWAPCAGPILGLLLTGAALKGASVGTSFLLFSYALGSAASLAVALLAGDRVFQAMKRSLGVEMWIRRGLGIAALAGVVMIALGWDRGVLTSLSLRNTSGVEQNLLDSYDRAHGKTAKKEEGPDLTGAVMWLNSEPLTRASLRGKVVLVDFWTYSCINCLRSLPYVRAWDAKYRSRGLVVIGVHTPEFAFEKDPVNVKRAVKELGVMYPVAIDNNYAIWNAFHNLYWPAHYFIDAEGRIRGHHFGEGDYDGSERLIQELLHERDGGTMGGSIVQIQATGTQAKADVADIASPETYLGYGRAEHFASPESVKQDEIGTYTLPSRLSLNAWGLAGRWTVGEERVELHDAPGTIAFRFHARDMHIVLGPRAPGASERFQVLIDGHAPGADAGVDVDAAGFGTVREHRLYQLIRQKQRVVDRTVEIRFLDPGVDAYSFTFG